MNSHLAIIAAIGILFAINASGMEIPETNLDISVDINGGIIVEGKEGLLLRATAGMELNDEYPRAAVGWMTDQGEVIRRQNNASYILDNCDQTLEVAFINGVEYHINRYYTNNNLTWAALTFPGEWSVNNHQFVPSANKVVIEKMHS